MRTSDFEYPLPPEAIAQPPARRDQSRMLVLGRTDGAINHRYIADLPTLFAPGDCLVVNDTKVFRARLHGEVDGKAIELLLVRPASLPPSSRGGVGGGGVRGMQEGAENSSTWLVLAKPARRLKDGATVMVGELRGVVVGREDDGAVRIAFDRAADAVIAYANEVGEVPTPPYIEQSVSDLDEYQTAYAEHVGSVAAPTAGFHFTDELLVALRAHGVRIATITLHVGLGTFHPIRAENIEDHTMHAEWVEVTEEAARVINETKERGSRVIAVGTTTLRTLEGVAQNNPPPLLERFSPCLQGELEGVDAKHQGEQEGVILPPYAGFINLYITPGFHFRVVDALITNFHLPKSSLLVLVSAFSAPGEQSLRGRDMVLRAYREALAHDYRFYSFGDAMLIC
ncbi:MAG: tRNA preQ1(34) S-adenosylmethionine ribosyltransferase-isomerase QueA [Candidatus Uhrbacteria bacterium]